MDTEEDKPEYLAVRFKDLVDPFRPLRAVEDQPLPGFFLTYDPVHDWNVPIPKEELIVLGKWEETSPFTLRDKPVTWSQYAAHQLGQVLRQNMLVRGLICKGITRIQLEPYAAPLAKYHKWRYDFNLTYDEVDALLSPTVSELR